MLCYIMILNERIHMGYSSLLYPISLGLFRFFLPIEIWAREDGWGEAGK